MRSISRLALLLALAAIVGACRQDMHDQPRFETYEAGARRAPVEGTVARGALAAAALAPSPTPQTASAGATPAADPRAWTEAEFPFPITPEVLARGESRYNINCAPCHSRTGDGNGMIVQRGFKRPPSYHEDRLRNSSASYFYDVMTNGFGAMYSYAEKLSPEDRWKVAAYIRVLQLSQQGRVEDLPPAERAKLESGATQQAPQGGQHR